MGILERLSARYSGRKSVSLAEEYGVSESVALMANSGSGVRVNWERALNVSTVFACIRVIANGVAQVPLRVMEEMEGGKGSRPAVDHPLYRVLNRRPNKWQTSFELRETLVFHVALTGNAFFYKNIIRGQIKELLPIDPGSVTIVRKDDMSIEYIVAGQDGTTKTVPADLIWHVRGPSWDSWRGLDAVKQAREAIGLAIATENTQAELHANGMQTSGTYTTDQKIGPAKFKELQDWISKQIGGRNRHKPFIIDSNFKWNPQSMTGVDAQHLETRRYQVEQICQSLGVFPQMIGHPGQSMTFASAEQVFLAHVVHCESPWWKRIEESIDNNLLNGEGNEKYFAKFNGNGLMRGAFKDRAEFYAKALGSGGSPAWMTPNEIRELEDLNPIDGGDVLPRPPQVGGFPSNDDDPEEDPDSKDPIDEE